MAKRRRAEMGFCGRDRGGLTRWLLTCLRKALYSVSDSDTYNGIKIINLNTTDTETSVFVNATHAALDLIMLNDPRRARMVRRELKYIVNEVLDSSAIYQRGERCCKVDFTRYNVMESEAHYEWYIAAYASTIIHEATHGRIYSSGISYNKKTRVRIERICRKEQQRFAERLTSGRYNFARDLVPPFNEADWHPYWNVSRMQSLRRTWKLIQRVLHGSHTPDK